MYFKFSFCWKSDSEGFFSLFFLIFGYVIPLGNRQKFSKFKYCKDNPGPGPNMWPNGLNSPIMDYWGIATNDVMGNVKNYTVYCHKVLLTWFGNGARTCQQADFFITGDIVILYYLESSIMFLIQHVLLSYLSSIQLPLQTCEWLIIKACKHMWNVSSVK